MWPFCCCRRRGCFCFSLLFFPFLFRFVVLVFGCFCFDMLASTTAVAHTTPSSRHVCERECVGAEGNRFFVVDRVPLLVVVASTRLKQLKRF